MRPPEKFSRVVNRKRYDVEKSQLIASDAFWDGHNFERHGRNTFLYRTPRNAFFVIHLTCWQGEQDTLTPVSLDEAIEYYENHLPEHYVKYEQAFPSVTIEEA